ncbi:MAG: dihydrolipoamide acetyltransferase family protein, partial [Terriglobales bacterium]
MPVDVVMPQMGESVVEGTVTKWLRKPGESVRQDEPLFEISTDKVDAEIPAPASGILKEIKVAAGQTVEVNTVVAILETGTAGTPRSAEREAGSAPSAQQPAPSVPPPSQAPAASVRPPAAAPEPTPTPATAAEVRSSPLVRRLAAEHNIDLSRVAPTGDGGRVSKRDVMNFIESGAAPPPPSAAAPAAPAPSVSLPSAPAPRPAAPAPAPVVYAPGSVRIEPMTLMRKRIAEHMVMSKRTSPHVYTIFAVDVTTIARVREQEKARFESSTGQKLTFMPFFCQATVAMLRQFPVINSSMQEDSIVYKNDINLGIAVSLDWGLIVPVIKHAEEKNFLGLQHAINDLSARART